MPTFIIKFYCLTKQLLILVLILVGGILVPVQPRTDPGDVCALRDIFRAINPISIRNGSCLSSWDLSFSLDPCDRLFSDRFTCGLRCDFIDPSTNLSRVTDISLEPAGYSGSLPLGSLSLPYLRVFDISGNSLSGSIPSSFFAGLPALTVLSLSGNALSGEVPDSIGAILSLEELYLDNNCLIGSIPSAIARLSNLKQLELQSNRLTSNLPDLSSLGKLYLLDASNNSLSGNVPSVLPPSLIELSLRENQFTGDIPLSMGNSSPILQVLDISHNNLTGSIPSSLFHHPSLEQITLSYNNFTSVQCPNNYGLNNSLIALDLSHNELQGFLPTFIPLMPKLSALSLEYNKFTGMIPAEYALRTAGLHDDGVATFERLLLGGNYLLGPVPGVFTGLTPGSANVSLVDNCLIRCPEIFYFCRGRNQKSLKECKRFSLVIP